MPPINLSMGLVDFWMAMAKIHLLVPMVNVSLLLFLVESVHYSNFDYLILISQCLILQVT